MYWIVDVVFFVLLIGGILLGVKKGFIEGLCSLAGTLFAFFCVSFEGFLENTFHMTTALSDKLVGAFASNPNMNVEIGGDTATALQNAGIPGFLANFMASALGSNTLPEGTTAAMLFGATVGKWIAILISFLALVILVRLGAFLLSKLLSGKIAHSVIYRFGNLPLASHRIRASVYLVELDRRKIVCFRMVYECGKLRCFFPMV